MAIDVAWSDITDGQVDADSPVNQILMQSIKDDLYHLEAWLGKSYAAANDHQHDGIDSALVALADFQVITSKLNNGAVSMIKIVNGTLHALPTAPIESTEYSTTGDGWVTKQTFLIYIPGGAQKLYGTFRVYRGTDGNDCFVRFQVDGNPSSTFNILNTSYEWSDECYYDCSALGGWKVLKIDIDAQTTRTTYLQGYSFRWGY